MGSEPHQTTNQLTKRLCPHGLILTNVLQLYSNRHRNDHVDCTIRFHQQIGESLLLDSAGGGGCSGGRAVAGVSHTSASSGGVGAAADEVAPPPVVTDCVTCEVGGDVNAMPCEHTDLDTPAPTSCAIASPTVGTSSPVTRISPSLAVPLKIDPFGQ